MSEAAIKAMEAKIPEKLMAIARHAGQAAAGFTVLGDWDALREFQNEINNRLKEKGWPLYRKVNSYQWQEDEESTEIIEGLHWTVDRITEHKHVRSENDYGESDKSLRRTLAFHILMDGEDKNREAIRDFILQEKNLSALDDTVREVIGEMTNTYGDPLIVKFNQRSLRKAFSDAVADKMSETRSVEGRLCDRLKALVATMRVYAKKDWGAGGMEFQGRMNGELKQMGWPLDSERGSDTLTDQLWTLAGQAQFRTSVNVRLALQDETVPPAKKNRAAMDFILAHMDDIDAAKKIVTDELDRELATEYGLVPRHINLHYEDGREKKAQPRTPPGP